MCAIEKNEINIESINFAALLLVDGKIKNVNIRLLEQLNYLSTDKADMAETNFGSLTNNTIDIAISDKITLYTKSGVETFFNVYHLFNNENIYVLYDSKAIIQSVDNVIVNPSGKAGTRGSLIKKLNLLCKNKNNNFTLMGLNIRSFTNINNVLGFTIGDHILKETAARMNRLAPENSEIFNLCSDVFVILIKKEMTKIELKREVKKIVHGCEEEFFINNRSINCKFHIGVLTFPGSGVNCDELIKHLNFSLRKSKSSGLIQYFYHEDYKDYDLYLDVVSDLESAIDNEQLTIVYQPIVSYENGESKIISAESLIRWFHDKYKFIPPDYFIRIAEDIGLIDKINLFVFKKVMADLDAMTIPAECTTFKMSINLSLRVQNIPSHLSEISKLVRSYIPKDERVNLQIEFTETAIFKDESSKQILRMFMRECKAKGIYFAMDDFGVEHSSINRLLEFHFDVIKIDKQFIQRIGGFDDVNTIFVIESIINLVKNLGCKVVAEGVETMEQAEILNSFQCDLYQGYLFYKPLSFDDFIDVLAND